MSIVDRFSKNLSNIEYPKEKCSWNISGMLLNKSNQVFKFDVRPMFEMPSGELGKTGNTSSKADKMVFETEKEWIILDTLELNEYVRKQNKKCFNIQELLKDLSWNTIIYK